MTKPTSQGDAPGEFDLRGWLARQGESTAIVQAGAQVLRSRARNVSAELLGTRELEELAAVMVRVMRQAPGVGLAAPQIGVPLRLFVAEDEEERIAQLPEETRRARSRSVLPLTVLVNPSVTRAGSEEATFFEGCLSVRGYAALVPRWSAVTVSALDLAGKPVNSVLRGWAARIVQHEQDHLDGTLYVDRMITRSLACEAELPRLGAMSVDEVLRELVGNDRPPAR